MKRLLLGAFAALFFGGCAGYHLGPAKPNALGDVQTISIPTFRNISGSPRIEALVTSTLIKQFQQDGSFRIVNEGADAVLKGEIVRIGRSPARSVRGNVLATTEFNLGMSVRYTLTAKDGRVLSSAEINGATSFFVSTDVTTDERQALPLATEDLARRLVSQLSEGW